LELNNCNAACLQQGCSRLEFGGSGSSYLQMMFHIRCFVWQFKVLFLVLFRIFFQNFWKSSQFSAIGQSKVLVTVSVKFAQTTGRIYFAFVSLTSFTSRQQFGFHLHL